MCADGALGPIEPTPCKRIHVCRRCLGHSEDVGIHPNFCPDCISWDGLIRSLERANDALRSVRKSASR